MALHLSQLVAIHQRLKTYISENLGNTDDPKSVVSKFWMGAFSERDNMPDLNGMVVFRRGTFTRGVGGNTRAVVEDEQAIYETMVKLARQFVPSDFLHCFDESLFGSPQVFEYDGLEYSTGTIKNIPTTWECFDNVKRFLSEKRPLTVCEIGAGYGGAAYQLFRVLNIQNYTICDLPENLWLSGHYLPMNLPEYDVTLIDSQTSPEILQELPEKSLYFSLPHHFERITAKYDVIINTSSLQEMSQASVTAYIDWIERHLKPNGLFFSLNTHGKDEVLRASLFGFQRFHIHRFYMFRKMPVGLFHRIPYIMILAPRTPKTPIYSETALDALADMMLLGLTDDISGLVHMFLKDDLTSSDHQYLQKTCTVFAANSTDEKYRALEVMFGWTEYTLLTHFLKANVLIADNRFDEALVLFRQCLDDGLQGFARVRALLLVCLIMRKQGKSHDLAYINEMERLAPSLMPHILDILGGDKLSLMQEHIHKIINWTQASSPQQSHSHSVKRMIRRFIKQFRT